MSLTDFVRGWGVRRESPVSRPLPPGSTLPLNQRSVPGPPTCGATDVLSGAICTLPAHSARLHRDNTDPSTPIDWWDDEWTRHPNKPWTPPTLRLIGAHK